MEAHLVWLRQTKEGCRCLETHTSLRIFTGGYGNLHTSHHGYWVRNGRHIIHNRPSISEQERKRNRALYQITGCKDTSNSGPLQGHKFSTLSTLPCCLRRRAAKLCNVRSACVRTFEVKDMVSLGPDIWNWQPLPLWYELRLNPLSHVKYLGVVILDCPHDPCNKTCFKRLHYMLRGELNHMRPKQTLVKYRNIETLMKILVFKAHVWGRFVGVSKVGPSICFGWDYNVRILLAKYPVLSLTMTAATALHASARQLPSMSSKRSPTRSCKNLSKRRGSRTYSVHLGAFLRRGQVLP